MSWCGCDPGASPFFAERLHDCVYSGRDALGWAFGMASLCCWLCAMVPQLLENWRNRSVEAMSAGLVAFWVTGDVCNLVGSVLSRQLVTQQMLGMYFVTMDVFLVGQFVYFQSGRGVVGRHRGPDTLPKTQEGIDLAGKSSNKNRLGGARHRLGSYRLALAAAVCGGLLVLAVHWWWTAQSVVKIPAPVQSHDDCTVDPATERLGTIFGSISAIMYVSSRVPQIYKNWQRKNTEGLAVRTFVMALSGNGLYSLSVLARARQMLDIMKAAPWLLGSAGVMCQDAMIIYQTLIYRRVKHNKSDADIPILTGSRIA